MDVIGKIADAMGGSILGGIKDLVRTFKLPPEEQLKFEAASLEHESKLTAAIAQATSEAIKAEAASGDIYVRRARPTFLYIVYVILVFNYLVVPLIQMTQGIAMHPIEFPEPLYWLFGSGYLGYVGGRTWEKMGWFGKRSAR